MSLDHDAWQAIGLELESAYAEQRAAGILKQRADDRVNAAEGRARSLTNGGPTLRQVKS